MTDAITSTAIHSPKRQLTAWANLLRQSTAAHWLVIGLPLIALIPVELTMATIDEPQRRSWLEMATAMVTFTLPLALLTIALLRLVQMSLYEKPPSPFFALVSDFRVVLCSPARWVNALPVIVAVLLCTKALLDIKMNIPAIQPFSWDEAMMRLDRQLHGGIDPWVWLQPMLGYAPISFLINIAYNLWLVVLFAAWAYMAFKPTFDVVRQQFLISFMLAWLFGGCLLAAAFSSAGPVYYGLLGLAPDPYAPLLDYLRATDLIVPIWALDMHKLLWDGYTGEIAFMGISAFPSMHATMATLFMLLGWQLHRTAGIWLTGFAVLILLGSVHLAWHYAIDSYAGVLIGVLSWWVAGRLVRWNMTLPHVRQYRAALDHLGG